MGGHVDHFEHFGDFRRVLLDVRAEQRGAHDFEGQLAHFALNHHHLARRQRGPALGQRVGEPVDGFIEGMNGAVVKHRLHELALLCPRRAVVRDQSAAQG